MPSQDEVSDEVQPQPDPMESSAVQTASQNLSCLEARAWASVALRWLVIDPGHLGQGRHSARLSGTRRTGSFISKGMSPEKGAD